MFCLVMSSYLLMKNRIGLSALCLSLACASKHTACLFVPFFVTFAWTQAPSGGKLTAIRNICPVVIVPALLILPFVMWDAPAFVDDTLLYMSGQAATSYPIRGLGVGSLLPGIGVIDDKNAYFPFMLLQAASCLPLLAFLLKRRVSLNTVRQSWLGYGLLLLTFAFFSLFPNHDLPGVAVTVVGIGLLVQDDRTEMSG